MKVGIASFGCKLNQADLEEIKEALLEKGASLVSFKERVDCYLVFACSVTQGAEQITRQAIHRIKRENPQAKIFVGGCLFKNLPEINFYSSQKKTLLKEIIKNLNFIEIAPKNKKIGIKKRTRLFLKIQEGCLFSCSYCLIPYLRGKKSLSYPPQEIIEKIKKKTKEGTKEVVLSGVNILLYNFQGINLIQLVKKILKETEISRIRFSSLDPRLVSSEFLELFKEKRICPHLHLSLQSASSKILKLMGRNYTPEKYFEIVKIASQINPLVSFTTDIIVGFPDETEDDFQETYWFVQKVGFLKIHVFPFSPRKKTRAFFFRKTVPSYIKKERVKLLNQLNPFLQKKFIQKMKGKKLPVLFEEMKGGFWQGYTHNYLKIRIKSEKNLYNQIEWISI